MNKPLTEKTADSLVERQDKNGVATLTLNRPAQYNCLSESVLDVLETEVMSIAESDTRVVVLAGAGKAFCAGHDLKEMQANPAEDYYRELFERCARLMLSLRALPQPVIARVHGLATAAGCQLVAACDMAVASSEASFAVSGINVGLFCSVPAVPLSRNLAAKKAFEMLVTGEFVDAQEALRIGLVNRVVAPAELDNAVSGMCEAVISKSPLAVATGKRMFYQQLEKPLEEAYLYASGVMARNMMAKDAAEGVAAFFEKRPPRWRGD